MSTQSTIENEVYESIRKTINRFRENPLYTFTESDLHSYLHNDLLSGRSKLFYAKHKHNISLVHLEYPTNFRYQKKELTSGYKDLSMSNYKSHKTYIAAGKKYGDRGNFDLAVLNPLFINNLDKYLLELAKSNTEINSEHKLTSNLINKDVSLAINRLNNQFYNKPPTLTSPSPFEQEVLFAIEFKFIHPFNARNKNMIDEVIKDNEKLRLAYIHSNGFIKPINLIFCSSKSMKRRDKLDSVIEQLKNYIQFGRGNGIKHELPENVLTIFIESYIDDDIKKTKPPIASHSSKNIWMQELCAKLKID
jgi:hypothetical protein